VRYWTTIFLAAFWLAGVAQNGNEWIVPAQQYYKVKTAEDGIYRIEYDELVSAGLVPGLTNPQNFQLFHRGEQIAITVAGQGDVSFDPGDYIEFYGSKNDGTLDQQLYKSPDLIPHNYYNLYSDSTAYFLTVGGSPGKRIQEVQPIENIGGLPVEQWVLKEELEVYSRAYSRGFTLNNYVALTAYDTAEGFTGGRILEGNSDDYSITAINAQAPAGPSPELYIVLAGRSSDTSRLNIQVGPDVLNLRSLGDYEIRGFNILKLSLSILSTDISTGGDLIIRFTNTDTQSGNVSLFSPSLVRLSYPVEPSTDSDSFKKIQLRSDASNEIYLELDEMDNSYSMYDITDLSTVRRLGFALSGSIGRTVINGAATERKIALANSASSLDVERVDLSIPVPGQYLIITHPLLRTQGDPVAEYASYRSGPSGGSYDVSVHNIMDLYNIFSYGEISPLAILNFCRYAYQNAAPEFLFLIGKGLEPRFKAHRPGNESLRYRDLVPTAGDPASDSYYTAGLSGVPNLPAFAVGRLPASMPSEVQNYLVKVRNQETFPNTLQDKSILHLSGGRTEGEQNLFRFFMDGFKAIAEEPALGGSVETLQRTSDGLSEKIDIREQVNDGLGMITMFGHSNEFFVDIDIGYASDPSEGYNNTKYPLIFANGCNAGRIFIDTLQWGPDWVLTGNRGSVGLIAHTFFGFSNFLRTYTRLFYVYAAGDSISVNEPVGVIQNRVAEDFLSVFTDEYFSVTQVQQMLLTGDPALRLFTMEKPDYAVENPGLEIDAFEGRINSRSDSLKVSLKVNNIGLAVDDSLQYRVSWQLPDTVLSYFFEKPSAIFQDTIEFVIYRNGQSALGQNRIEVEVNSDRAIDEGSFANNIAFSDLNIPSAGTINIYPQPFQIVSTTQVPIKVQSGTLLPVERDLELQISSSPEFTGAVTEMKSFSALLEDTLQVSNADSSVYYWRTRYANPQPEEDTTWTESSFMYIDGSTFGFAQADVGQFLQNGTSGLSYNDNTMQWEFASSASSLRIVTHGNQNPDNDFTTVEVLIDGLPYILPGRLCRNNSLAAIAFDQNSLNPYVAIEGLVVNPITCGRTPQVINSLTNADIVNRDTLSTYFNNVREGDFIVFFSIGNLNYPSWSTATKTLFTQIGVDALLLDTLEAGEPLIFFGRKGGDGTETRYSVKNDTSSIVDPAFQTIFLETSFDGVLPAGTMKTVDFGPASSWTSVAVQVNEQSPAGNASITLFEKERSGTENIVLQDVAPPGTTFNSVKPVHNAQIVFYDSISLNAPQPDYYITRAEPLPEGVLLFVDNESGSSLSNEIEEGVQFTSTFVFQNISSTEFGSDSLSVSSSIGDRQLDIARIAAPQPGKADTVRVQIDTRGLNGLQDLVLTINEERIPEVLYENNTIVLEDYLSIQGDKASPVIDVTFDGQYILDGDIVSPEPLIQIRLKDENQFLLKEDTVGVIIILDSTQIFLSDPMISWQAATEEDDFEIRLRPDRLRDGKHTLRVNLEDASGNAAGTDFLSISFDVVNESSITHFYPYPNPFSTSTQFVFTLTGSEIPTEIKIQILTVSGRVVREINQDELGPLRIGNNRTDFAWDGRDEFGDQLANGVYLYRVIARLNGEQLKQRETSADRGFKNGYGKIYLLR